MRPTLLSANIKLLVRSNGYYRHMMRERPAHLPADVVIAVSTFLLGALAGVGAAVGFWSQLQHTADPGMLTAAVAALSVGLVLISVAARNLAARLFLLASAFSLAIAFFAGSGAFSHLLS
jgi:hypothetical protein